MTEENGKHFTPTQKRILAILADGEPHLPDDLIVCLQDEMGTRDNVQDHIGRLRKILRPKGQDIVCQYRYRRYYYRHVRLINTSE